MNNKNKNVVPPHLHDDGDTPIVLIYDDDVEILSLCKAILSKCQCRVDAFTHCENVIEDVQRLKPAVILMDLWIPTLGGEKAVKLLKEDLSTQHIPIILFSANAEIKEISRRANADGYIAKPFDVVFFKNTIAGFVDREENSKK